MTTAKGLLLVNIVNYKMANANFPHGDDLIHTRARHTSARWRENFSINNFFLLFVYSTLSLIINWALRAAIDKKNIHSTVKWNWARVCMAARRGKKRKIDNEMAKICFFHPFFPLHILLWWQLNSVARATEVGGLERWWHMEKVKVY